MMKSIEQAILIKNKEIEEVTRKQQETRKQEKEKLQNMIEMEAKTRNNQM
jgi:hypothetical protein